MVAVAWLMAGCIAHAGPTLGWRSRNAFAIGWHGGVGATALEVVAGESYVGGRPFSYGGLGAHALADDAMAPSWMVGGSAGAGRGDRGGTAFFGAEVGPFVRADGDRHSGWAGTLTFGIRVLGPEVEVFARPEVMYLVIPHHD